MIVIILLFIVALGFLVFFPVIVIGGSLLGTVILWLWKLHRYGDWRLITDTSFVGKLWKLLRSPCSFGDQFRKPNDSEATGRASVGKPFLQNTALLLQDPTLIKRSLGEMFNRYRPKNGRFSLNNKPKATGPCF